MSLRAPRHRCEMVGALALVVGAVAPFGCSGSGNTGRPQVSDQLAAQVPWVNGRPPIRDEDGRVVTPDEPVFPAIATGLANPGSGPIDCSTLDGLEFSNVWFETFEADPAYPNPVGVAEAWATHDDSSEGSFRAPGELNWYAGLAGRHGAAWGLPARRVDDGPSCDGVPNEWALNFRGGRFNRFGGGLGHPMALLVRCPEAVGDGRPDDLLCPPLVDADATHDAAGIPVAPTLNDESSFAQAHDYWNVSGFDGIAFWGRRGPESQGSLTVIIQDKHTSEDLARENQTFCRRRVECHTECLNRAPCSPVDPDDENGEYRCYDPAKGAIQDNLRDVTREALIDEVFPRCGPSACTFPSSYKDRDFEGKTCQPYTFDSHTSGEFCFDDGDLAPPDTGELCGDGYARTVTLTTDWQFFAVPFSELRQQGFGKVSPEMDLTTISNISFVVMTGWADVYLDNVTLYRRAP